MQTQFKLDREILQRWMSQVLQQVRRGVREGQSPFAAAIYSHSGDLVVCENNTVRGETMVSRHGEVNALDAACRTLGTVELAGYVLVSSGEPCPMCAAAAATAKVDAVVFGADCQTISEAGYPTLGLPCRSFFEAIDCDIQVIGGIYQDLASELLLNHPRSD